MKLFIAVLALVCLSGAAQASQQKLPLAGLLLANHGDVNVSISDLLPQVNVSDIAALLHAIPKFQMPVANLSGLSHSFSMGGNGTDIQIPLVPLLGLKAAVKALPIIHLLGAINMTGDMTKNFTMPSLPSVNVSQMAVPLHALLGAGKAAKALPLMPLLALVNASHSIQMPKMPSMNLNISDVGVPLHALLGLKFKGLPLLAHLVGGNTSLSLPVVTLPHMPKMFNVSMGVSNGTGMALPLHALLGLKALPLGALAAKGAALMSMLSANVTAVHPLAGLTKSFNVSGMPMGSLAALTKSFNVSGLPLALLAGHALSGMGNASMGMMAAGPSVGINVVPGSIGMKNVAFNLSHPTLGMKNVALALNLTHPELAMKLAALNLTLPVPDLKMGSSRVNLTLPVPDLSASMGNVTFTLPTAGVTMPRVDIMKGNSSDGNSTGLNVGITKPSLTMGSANVTLPTITPQLAMKLAQLGINLPHPQLGMKRATIGATVPMPDVTLAQRAVNVTLPMPDVGMKQVGVNLTLPNIQLPRLELNVSGMPKLSLDGVKSATLLAWLKDAGFYSTGTSTEGNATVINLGHHGH